MQVHHMVGFHLSIWPQPSPVVPWHNTLLCCVLCCAVPCLTSQSAACSRVSAMMGSTPPSHLLRARCLTNWLSTPLSGTKTRAAVQHMCSVWGLPLSHLLPYSLSIDCKMCFTAARAYLTQCHGTACQTPASSCRAAPLQHHAPASEKWCCTVRHVACTTSMTPSCHSAVTAVSYCSAAVTAAAFYAIRLQGSFGLFYCVYFATLCVGIGELCWCCLADGMPVA